MSKKLALPLDDPFTDEHESYESRLPETPNPLGSHPPDPVRCCTPSLARLSEEVVVNASPRSSTTVWSDIELQQRSSGPRADENDDKAGILPQSNQARKWYRKPRNILLLAIIALLLCGVAIGAAAAAIYSHKRPDVSLENPMMTLSTIRTTTRTHLMRISATMTAHTTSTADPPTPEPVTVATSTTKKTVWSTKPTVEVLPPATASTGKTTNPISDSTTSSPTRNPPGPTTLISNLDTIAGIAASKRTRKDIQLVFPIQPFTGSQITKQILYTTVTTSGSTYNVEDIGPDMSIGSLTTLTPNAVEATTLTTISIKVSNDTVLPSALWTNMSLPGR